MSSLEKIILLSSTIKSYMKLIDDEARSDTVFDECLFEVTGIQNEELITRLNKKVEEYKVLVGEEISFKQRPAWVRYLLLFLSLVSVFVMCVLLFVWLLFPSENNSSRDFLYLLVSPLSFLLLCLVSVFQNRISKHPLRVHRYKFFTYIAHDLSLKRFKAYDLLILSFFAMAPSLFFMFIEFVFSK